MLRETYRIITDEEALKDFIQWLPQEGKYEQYYVALFSRKKYAPGNEACNYDKTQLKRFSASKDWLLNKIRQLECPVGTYLGHKDLPVPQESLALYISLNPRDLHAATFGCIADFATVLKNRKKEEFDFNPQALAMNNVQTAYTNSRFHVFDVDGKSDEKMRKIYDVLGPNYNYIETNGGYHIVVDKSKIPNIPTKQWYLEMKRLSDVKGDCLTPVPGTYQGGFTPKLKIVDQC